MLLVGGVDAKLSRASHAATEQKLKASKTRGLKKPDLEAKYFRMVGFFLWIFW
jgi:hypothetical protein